MKSSGIKKLRARNYRGDDDEWAAILSYSFGQIQKSNVDAEWISGLEVLASVQATGDNDEENKELHITLRKRIDSITVCTDKRLDQSPVFETKNAC